VVEPLEKAPTTFGWDDRTNLPAQADRTTKEYWNRPGAPGSSGSNRDLDGSIWVAVTAGKTADIDLRFVGQSGPSCITNVTAIVDSASVATVSPTTYASTNTRLTVTGVGAGETSVKLKCNGAEIGWFHIVCHAPKTASMVVYRINLRGASVPGPGGPIPGPSLTPATPFTAADMTAIKTDMDNVYAQAGITWNVTYGGVITYTTADSVAAFHASLGAGSAPNTAQFGKFITDIGANLPTAAPAGRAPRRLYYLEAPPGYSQSGGRANGIPSNDCLIYAPWNGNWGRQLLVHELGHNVGLYHPNDPRSAATQLPDNFRLPLALSTSGAASNCMFSDHHNIMGYGCDEPPGSAIRYGQWGAARVNA
jgi:hypothetical protein